MADNDLPTPSGSHPTPRTGSHPAPFPGLPPDHHSAPGAFPPATPSPDRAAPPPIPAPEVTEGTPAPSYGFVAPTETGRRSPWGWIIGGGVLLLVAAIVVALFFVINGFANAARTAIETGVPGTSSTAPTSPTSPTSPAAPAAPARPLGEGAPAQLLDVAPLLEVSGTGPQDIVLETPAGANDLVHFQADGETWASIESLDANGEPLSPILSGRAPVDGVTSLHGSSGAYKGAPQATALRVDAEGPWTVRVLPLEAAPELAPGSPLSGSGSAVIRLAGEATFLEAEHAGDSNFIVWARDREFSGKLLVNEIGDTSDRVELPEDSEYLIITSRGTWTIQSSE